jgi:hypothetical protein
MLRFRLAVAALLLACIAPAHAGERVTLPDPWHAGRTLAYATHGIDSQHDAEGHAGARMGSDTTLVTVTRVDADGVHEAWRVRDSEERVFDGDLPDEDFYQGVKAAFDATGFDVLAGPDGYRRFENADAIGAALRDRLRAVSLARTDTELQTVDAASREAARAEAQRAIEANLARTTTPAALEEAISGTFRDYHRFLGRTLEAGITHTEPSDLVSPGGGAPVPATLQYVLLSAPAGAPVAVIEWKRTLDVGRARDRLWDMADAAAGKTTPADARVGVPEGMASEDSGTLRIDRATGVVLASEHVRRSTNGGVTKAAIEWMTLVDADAPAPR